jgi:hypothetical protein
VAIRYHGLFVLKFLCISCLFILWCLLASILVALTKWLYYLFEIHIPKRIYIAILRSEHCVQQKLFFCLFIFKLNQFVKKAPWWELWSVHQIGFSVKTFWYTLVWGGVGYTYLGEYDGMCCQRGMWQLVLGWVSSTGASCSLIAIVGDNSIYYFNSCVCMYSIFQVRVSETMGSFNLTAWNFPCRVILSSVRHEAALV